MMIVLRHLEGLGEERRQRLVDVAVAFRQLVDDLLTAETVGDESFDVRLRERSPLYVAAVT
jgi:hypothetical protein